MLSLTLAALACSGGSTAPATTSGATPTTPTGSSGSLVVSSTDMANATLPVAYTCDGSAISPPVGWTGAPSGTVGYALVMTTIPSPGQVKYNWLLYNIPAATTNITAGATAGTVGFADDGGGLAYAPPCSQGPGLKQYSFAVYALSAAPNLTGLSPNQVTGAALTAAIQSVTIASGTLTVGVNRTVALINCGYLRSSIASYKSANALDLSCDSTYGSISTFGIQSKHAMMNGIIATIQQVPIPQNFTGTNAWRIPLVPQVAATKTAAVDGPIGIAVNGVPIFNPCKQGGCTGPGGGDTKVQGELDLCNGHAGRADDYHYHAAPICMMADQGTAYWDTHPLGWALDGYAIFGYRNPDGTTATRDVLCGGNTLTHSNAPSGYAYHVTDVSPYVLSCFYGTPSPDLAIQGSKYSPIRPPGTPMPSSNLTLNATANSLAIGGTTTMQWQNAGRTYQIRYTRTSAVCWTFLFVTDSVTQSTNSYCRNR